MTGAHPITPLPQSVRGGAHAQRAWEVRGFLPIDAKTLTSLRFAAGPSSPICMGEGLGVQTA